MTSSNKRPNFINSILQALLIVCILGFVLSTAWMFITSNADGVCAFGSISIYCLINTVGIILIQRWHKVGVWLCFIASLVEYVSLFIYGNPSTDLTLFDSTPYLPYCVPVCVFLIVSLPLFISKAQPSRKTIWYEMHVGLDVKHCRHIYQLTAVLLVGVIIAMLFYQPTVIALDKKSSFFNEIDDKTVVQRIVDYSLLDSADVTLNEIVFIESMIDSIPTDSQLVYNKRIFALKHILLSGLMNDKHNTLNLKNIYKIHTGEFSNEQQRVLDWYLALPNEDQEVWLDCPTVDNLSDFEKEVKQRISTR